MIDSWTTDNFLEGTECYCSGPVHFILFKWIIFGWSDINHCAQIVGALSIRVKIIEIPGGGANGTDIFRNFIPKFWVHLARLA